MAPSRQPATGRRRCTSRLDPRFRAILYVVVGLLFGTGAAWFAVDRLKEIGPGTERWQAASAWLLMLHGGAAMVFLLLLGGLIALHARIGWRLGNNRVSGSIMLTLNAVLVVTAFGLYYAGSETLRAWTSDIHIAVGLGFPALLAVHAVLGRRAVRAAREAAMDRAPEPAGASDRARLRRVRALAER
ncbi:MAG TPA: hypothetical protein VJ747_03685 [Stellaceae bacterium]|nr:hypothetical protein [Stellaceae bacterium]